MQSLIKLTLSFEFLCESTIEGLEGVGVLPLAFFFQKLERVSTVANS